MSESELMSKIVRPLRSGQVTIPADFRKELGITDDTLLRMTLVQGELRIRPVKVREAGDGSPWLKALYDRFAPIREEAAVLDSEDIDASFDQVVARVRKNSG